MGFALKRQLSAPGAEFMSMMGSSVGLAHGRYCCSGGSEDRKNNCRRWSTQPGSSINYFRVVVVAPWGSSIAKVVEVKGGDTIVGQVCLSAISVDLYRCHWVYNTTSTFAHYSTEGFHVVVVHLLVCLLRLLVCEVVEDGGSDPKMSTLRYVSLSILSTNRHHPFRKKHSKIWAVLRVLASARSCICQKDKDPNIFQMLDHIINGFSRPNPATNIAQCLVLRCDSLRNPAA